MRIVHVADSFAPDIGGIERQVEDLASRQRAEGHDVTVITAVAEHAETDLDVVRAAPGRWLTVAFPYRNRRVVAEVLDGRPIDVVHAHFTVISPMAIFVTRAASRRGIPVAITVHSLWWKVAAATRLSTLPFGWGRTVAAWSGVSSVAAAHVRRTLRGTHEVSVLPNLVNTAWWRSCSDVAREPDSKLRIVLVGRLKKRKHVNEFLDMLAAARRRLPSGTDVDVSIVGEGPRYDDLQAQIERLDLADWVRLLGHRDPVAIRAILHQSDLFVAPSRHEAFGIAALEARAAGLPVMGYQRSGLRDFVTNGIDGVLVADAAGMIDALATLIRQPERVHRMRTAATSVPPPIAPADAMRAVYELYARAYEMGRKPCYQRRDDNTRVRSR